ncbi:MAG: hypothetical protein ACNS62_23190 [Candidatus Cyclobacteriaceae bacterium M3_2C_046]
MLEILFILITILSIFLFYLGTGKDKRILYISILWFLIIGGIAASGYFLNTTTQPPRFLFVLLISLTLTITFYVIIDVRRIKLECLMGIHSLRLPVEIVLFGLYKAGLIPEMMTFMGWNFDILIGISAVLLLFYLFFLGQKLPERLIKGWNVAGLFFLMIIIIIAVLSSPLPIQQLAFDQPNVAVLYFPYILLPAYIVPVVMVAHLLAFKGASGIFINP